MASIIESLLNELNILRKRLESLEVLEGVIGGSTLADHDHSGDAGDGGTFDAANLTSGASTDGQVLTSDGAGGSAWEDGSGTLADHDHSGDVGDGGTFDAANLTSGASTDGQVLTSDGAGVSTWEDVPTHDAVTAGAGISVTDQVVSLGDVILVRTGSGVSEYAASGAGLTSALAAAASGSTVLVPPGTYTADYTVPANVVLDSFGGNATIVGTVTLGASSELIDMVVSKVGDSAGTVYGIVCSAATGQGYARQCSIVVSNAGAGDSVGVYTSGAGALYIDNCHIAVTADSGDGYGAMAGAGNVYVEHSRIEASTAPIGEEA